MIGARCPVCRTDLQAPDEYLGKNWRCTACQSHFIVGGDAAPAAPAHVAPSPAVRASALACAGALIVLSVPVDQFLCGGDPHPPDQVLMAAVVAGLVAAGAAFLGRVGVTVGLIEIGVAAAQAYWMTEVAAYHREVAIVAVGAALLAAGGLWSMIHALRQPS
jgi:hypothetical protein